VTARDAVLARVRAAVGSARPDVIPRRYVERGSATPMQVVDSFIERVRDYRATVLRVEDAAGAAAEVLAAQGARRIGIPADLDARLRPAGVELIEDSSLSAEELDGLDGALTTCVLACAATGTIALDGGAGQGRRALTLLPDLHVCVVREGQIVETVPELVRGLEQSVAMGRPLVLVSGPSATSDIELQRVEGVHGPRRLVVLVVR
jgi:L-lactate dehydrogenase complex protein LldG